MGVYHSSLYHDFQGIAALRHQARQDQAGSLEKVAKQFESLFLQMMVKQMRQASFGGGIFDSDRTRQYQDMYDKQLSLHLSRSGGMGIADMLRRQLAERQGAAVASLSGLHEYREHPVVPALRHRVIQAPESVDSPEKPGAKAVDASPALDTPKQFVRSLWASAERAAADLGLPPQALLAQAALETGWGGRVMPAADGQNSHNLFGIKADQRWGGDQVRRDTLEYEDGMAVRRRERFRAYRSYDDSFQDYVAFLRGNPRYAEALANTHDSKAYFRALQQAGYATDPEYADKILRVMQGPEMRAALEGFKHEASRPI